LPITETAFRKPNANGKLCFRGTATTADKLEIISSYKYLYLQTFGGKSKFKYEGNIKISPFKNRM
jgi:hypothetical protein